MSHVNCFYFVLTTPYKKLLIDWSENILTIHYLEKLPKWKVKLWKCGIPPSGFIDKIPNPQKQKNKSIPLSPDAEPVPVKGIQLKRKTEKLRTGNQLQTRLFSQTQQVRNIVKRNCFVFLPTKISSIEKIKNKNLLTGCGSWVFSFFWLTGSGSKEIYRKMRSRNNCRPGQYK